MDEEGPLFRITSKLLNPSFYLKLFERVGVSGIVCSVGCYENYFANPVAIEKADYMAGTSFLRKGLAENFLRIFFCAGVVANHD